MNPSAHTDTFARDNLPPPRAWPELRFDLPRLKYAARLNCATVLLDEAVRRGDGERIAIRAADGACTYMQLLAQANRIANVLVEDMGLRPGNRVLLRGPNSPMMAACWLAVVKAGGICVSTMPMLRAKELTDVITKAEVTHALCDQRLEAELANALPACPTLREIRFWHGDLDRAVEKKSAHFDNVQTAADDVALIAFTSGTTGKPKAAAHFHRDVIAMTDCFPPDCVKPSRDDIFCGTPPLAFTYGLGGLLAFPLRYGASTLLLEKLTPELLAENVQRHTASVLFSSPAMYRSLAPLAASGALPSLRKCVSAGEALPDATRQLFKQASGVEIIDGIGSTELIHMFISHAPGRVRRGATGYAVAGYQAAVLDEEGRPCKPGTVGRLAIKGPTGCKYLADDRQKNYVQDGWNITGDAYLADKDGYFFYQSRTDDMIVASGYNIAGPEVEGVLLNHPAVAECGVIGWPDEERGTIVKAVVVLKPGSEKNEALKKALQDHVKSTIAPYKYPRSIEFVDSLPRTETGKLQRYKLRTK